MGNLYNNKTDTAAVEAELNNLLQISPYSIFHDDIVVFGRININNMYPINYHLTDDNKIYIDDNINYINSDIYIGTNKQFFYKRIYINSTDDHFKITLDKYFETSWNKDKYLIFRNGFLLNKSFYDIIIPDWNNSYKNKIIYFMSGLYTNDYIDIFYIENNMFNIPISRDVFLDYERVLSTQDNQTIFNIPYPYNDYPKNIKSFFIVYNYKYIDRDNYQLSDDGNSIIFNNISLSKSDFLFFIFPYVRSDFDNSDKDFDIFGSGSGITFFYSWSIKNNNSNGLVNFYPRFTDFELTKNNFVLFANGIIIDPQRYSLINNYTIQFINTDDESYIGNDDIIMCVFNENINNRPFNYHLNVQSVQATQDNQSTFSIPSNNMINQSFFLYCNGILMEGNKRYSIDLDNNTITFLYQEDFLQKNKYLNFVFVETNIAKQLRTEEIQINPVYLNIPYNTQSFIIPYKYPFLIGNLYSNEVICFLNGIYIDNTRYSISTTNIFTFLDINDVSLMNPDGNELILIYLSKNDIRKSNEDILYLDDIKDELNITFDEMQTEVNQDGTITIPFPYTQFTEMQYFITNSNDEFIPGTYFKNIDDNTLISDVSLNLNIGDNLKFIFCHNKGFYDIQKLEQHIFSKINVNNYSIKSPYNVNSVHLNIRSLVFYNKKLLEPAYYTIDYINGNLNIKSQVEDNKDIDILYFFTGDIDNKSVSNIPMSGYLTFTKSEIDRNYNKNLFALFVNGKLQPSDYITDISNSIHKINTDIQSRYDVQALNMSTKIRALVPFYHKMYTRENDNIQQSYSNDMQSVINVNNDNIIANRNSLYETFQPYFDGNIDQSTYITLVQCVTESGYTLNFYQDQYEVHSPAIPSIMCQVIHTGENIENIRDSSNSVLMGQLPATIYESDNITTEKVLFSISIKAIVIADNSSNDEVKTVGFKFKINPQLTNEDFVPIWYDLSINSYPSTGEHWINIFKFIVSSQPNGKGEILYTKNIKFYPTNNITVLG